MKGLRVVLDTNVVLSALVFSQGRLTSLRRSWQSGAVTPLASSATMKELIHALGYPKFRLSADDQMELLSDYLPWCATMIIPVPPPRVVACRDPNDVAFLELAVTGRASFLVTGDKDLLAIGATGKLKILTPDLIRDEITGG